MSKTTPEQNKALVLEAFDTRFKRARYDDAERTARRARAVRGPVAGGLGVWRQRQLRVGGDIADIAVVADEADPAVAPLEPHHVARLRVGAVFEDRDHLPALDPGGGETP